MLYDPKWEGPSLAGLVAWLERQDPNQTYHWLDIPNCLLSQYYRAIGREPIVEITADIPFEGAGEIVLLGRLTFGAALERARKMLVGLPTEQETAHAK